MTTSTILYRIDTCFLCPQRLNEYAILILSRYQQHYAMQADILPDIRTISIWWNSPSTSRRSFNHSISNRYRRTTWKKHHFDIISIKATLCWTTYRPISNDINTIQFRWEHDIDQSMLEIRLQHRIRGKYAIMISFRYRYSYVGSIYHPMSYRYRYHVIPLSKRRQPFDVGEICGQRYR